MATNNSAAVALRGNWAMALASRGLTGPHVDAVLRALIDHLQSTAGGDVIYIPVRRAGHDVAALRRAINAGKSVREVCRTFHVDRRTLYGLIATEIDDE